MGTVAASLCDANLATCGLLHPLDCRLRNCWSLILSASEAKYRPEDDSQESETNSKPGTFTEALGHIASSLMFSPSSSSEASPILSSSALIIAASALLASFSKVLVPAFWPVGFF